MHKNRRFWGFLAAGGTVAGLVLLAALFFTGTEVPKGSGPSAGDVKAAETTLLEDRALGRHDAPLTVIEYASFTCGLCQEFHLQTFPKIKQAFIESGQIRFVFREFPLDEAALLASMTARCVKPERYFGFVDLLFRRLERWAGAQDTSEALIELAQIGGLSEEQTRECLGDEEIANTILAGRLVAERTHDVGRTPTFIIGSDKYEGTMSFETFEKIVGPYLAERAKGST